MSSNQDQSKKKLAELRGTNQRERENTVANGGLKLETSELIFARIGGRKIMVFLL